MLSECKSSFKNQVELFRLPISSKQLLKHDNP